MSVIKAFFGLGRIPKVKKYFEFESFDDLNQTGGMIGQIQETVRRGGLQLTPAQKKFLEDQMEQVKLAFDMTKISLKSPSPEKSGKVIQADFGKPFKEEIKKMETDAQIKARLEEGNKKSASALRIEKLRKEISDIDRKIDARVIQLEQRGVKDFETDSLFNKLNDQKNDLEFKKDFEEEIFGPQDMADGGRIGLRMGSRKKTATGDYEGFDLSYLKDLSPEVQKAFLRRLYTGNMTKQADGGRVGLKVGSMSKRAFLKMLAALGITGAAAKSGILSLGGKQTGKQVVKEVVKTANVAGKPEWFDSLVNKVILEGDDVTKNFATKERQIVHTKKIDEDNTVRVTQDLDEGSIKVEYDSDTNVFGDTVELKYKKPPPDEGDPRPSAEFTTSESGPVGRAQGPDDYDIEIDEVGGNAIEDLNSDVSKLKEFATGKKPTIKEMMQIKKRKDKAADISDDVDSAQMNEVIKRQGDYVDDDFSPDYASGGIARMLGE